MQGAAKLKELAKTRVLILDGAMGTAIQQRGLTADDFIYPGTSTRLQGCNDLLTLSRPDVIKDIHCDYIKANADIIETNTFGANAFSLKDYGLADKAYEMNVAAARLAREAADSVDRDIFVAGDIGPTGRSASFSPSVDDPAYRESNFAEFREMYREQVSGLIDGGVDLLIVETIFDTLIAKAALTAIMDEFEARQIELPIMVSATFSDKSRRTLSGQELEAFITSMSNFPIFTLGVNCSTGAAEMVPLIKDLADLSPFGTSAHPNAGFPDSDGNYIQTPDEIAAQLEPVLDAGLLNIIGGCCGTRPEHIAAIAKISKDKPPFKKVACEPVLKLSGWETLRIPREHMFITVGERANVAGSRKFARLIKEEKFEEAIFATRKQIEEGAQIIDICMDDALIDAPKAMITFLRLIAADPITARVPVMIDSSNWEVIEAALPEIQGRSIVNSISLKEGEEEFLRRANFIHNMGATAMVMLFDEKGQADTFERKIAVAERAMTLLAEKTAITQESIIIDPNILTIATGIDEHDTYARDYIRAIVWIKEHYPDAKTSGGLSNLSFSFRGNNPLRKAMHAIFLELAVEAGLDMAIVNPAAEMSTTLIPKYATSIIREALLLEKGDGSKARQDLIELAMSGSLKEEAGSKKPELESQKWRKFDVMERLSEALVRGDDAYLEADLQEAGFEHAMKLIEGPLMGGMGKLGELFGEGKVFLPQVVRSARIMKKAVDILKPYLSGLDDDVANARGTVVMATVKGDVHDIGKNIVSLVLQCNHFNVIDLGVMVPPENIFAAAVEHKADMVGLSGLITPSLQEMGEVCRQFNEADLDIPIMIGGATTSEAHTATRLAPLYPGRVIYTSDASDSVKVALQLAGKNAKAYKERVQKEYYSLESKSEKPGGKQKPELLSLKEARAKKYRKAKTSCVSAFLGKKVLKELPLDELISRINWKMFALAWQLKPNSDEAIRVKRDAEELLALPEVRKMYQESISAVLGFFKVKAHGDDLQVLDENGQELTRFYFLRQQEAKYKKQTLSLSDYTYQEGDTIGIFVATAGAKVAELSDVYRKEGDEYHALMINFLGDRFAEATSEFLQDQVETVWWKQDEHRIIRPSNGYPSAPDHSEKLQIFKLLDAEKELGVTLTESYNMKPLSSVCGYYFADADPHYFTLGTLSRVQLEDYAKRKGMDVETILKYYAGKTTEK